MDWTWSTNPNVESTALIITPALQQTQLTQNSTLPT